MITSSVFEPVKLRVEETEVFEATPISVVTAFSKVAQEWPDNIAIGMSYHNLEMLIVTTSAEINVTKSMSVISQ